MDFLDQIKNLGAKVAKQLDHIKTEEATKNALVMPFIHALGYDVFDPTEVVPEFTADIGIKKGEKVDYAIMREGKPIMIFETKWCQANLANEHASQLHRYFHTVEARIGVLTNGVVYKFYADIDEANKMDPVPFLEINMLDIREPLVAELKKLSKDTFNLDDMVSAASELKYLKEIKRILSEQLAEPTEPFVRFFTSQVYPGRMTQQVLERFTKFVRRGLNHFVNDRVNESFKKALSSQEEKAQAEQETENEEPEPDNGIVTTEEELEGFRIVKAIACAVLDSERITYRDTKSYFGILLDDNNRKPICRLHFNSATRYIGLFDDSKNETRIALESLDGIYEHTDKIKARIKHMLETASGAQKRSSERVSKASEAEG